MPIWLGIIIVVSCFMASYAGGYYRMHGTLAGLPPPWGRHRY